MTDRIYPFPPNVKTKVALEWWHFMKARLFGKKYHEFSGRYELKAYYYKGILYITRYRGL